MIEDLTGPTKDIILGDGWSIEDPSSANAGRRTLVAATKWTVPAMGTQSEDLTISDPGRDSTGD